MKPVRGFALVVILIVSALVIGIGGTVAYLKYFTMTPPPPFPLSSPAQPPSSPTAQSPSPDETVYTEDTRSANWKTYKNSNLGFSIKYPEDKYSVKIESTLGDWKGYTFVVLEPINIFNNKRPLAITYRIAIASVPNLKNFTIENPKNMFGNGPLEGYISDFLEGKTIMETSIGGQEAFVVNNLAAGLLGIEADIYTIKNNQVFEISITPAQVTGDPDKNKQLFSQILSTFKFLN